MAVLVSNNASSFLASILLVGGGSCTVDTGDGALFPTISGADYFYATLEDTSGNIEIVKVTARTGDVMTITRAQQGTSALEFPAGSVFELRMTASTFTEYVSGLVYNEWVGGPTPTYVSANSFTVVGDQTSDFTVGRRVRIVDTGGTKYGTIATSVYTSLTTITLDGDSDSLASPLTSVDWGLISGGSNSLPYTEFRIKTYSETVTANASSGTTETLDLSTANIFDLTLDDNCTLTFSNPTSATNRATSFTLILRQGGSGSYTVTWPASVDWPSGTAPTLSTAVSSVDMFNFITVDNGTTWLGFIAGYDIS